MPADEWAKLGGWPQDQTANAAAVVDRRAAELVDEVRSDRRMTLDLIDAVSAEAGVNPAKVRARLRPETRAALDKVD